MQSRKPMSCENQVTSGTLTPSPTVPAPGTTQGPGRVRGRWEGGSTFSLRRGEPLPSEIGTGEAVSTEVCDRSSLFMWHNNGEVWRGWAQGYPHDPPHPQPLFAAAPETGQSQAMLLFSGWALHSSHVPIIK